MQAAHGALSTGFRFSDGHAQQDQAEKAVQGHCDAYS